MNIPGLIAKHKVVTPQCRIKPEAVIKRETVDELWQAYLDALKGYGDDVVIHFALTIEQPKGEE